MASRHGFLVLDSGHRTSQLRVSIFQLEPRSVITAYRYRWLRAIGCNVGAKTIIISELKSIWPQQMPGSRANSKLYKAAIVQKQKSTAKRGLELILGAGTLHRSKL
ncbi:hypothetical protein CDL15_Pgr010913 [Punica granatum]|uniref:Uncharacterized protein n=1 Tax=Punica granatum TaxID=22663 RepID=A0A218XN43_PUNGR|nr:hypothetical protein CDL15_Pgr010913 [Punica granatum]